MPERIQTKHLNNTRDLGGMPAGAGCTVAKNRLLRSGELYGADSGDIAVLKHHKLHTVIDLRTAQECMERPSPSIPEIRAVHLPILKDAAQGISHEEKARLELEQALYSGELNDPDAARQLMEDMYRQMITSPFSLRQFTHFMELLIQNKDGAVLWHCAAGKDRTGIAAVLVLECLGVARNLIISDYLLTNQYMEDYIKQEAALLKEKEPSSDYGEVLSYLLGAKRIYIDIIYGTIEKRYGGVPNFLKEELRMDRDKIEMLKQNYLSRE